MLINFNPTSNVAKLIIVVELILVIYLLNTLIVSVYRGYQIDKVIDLFETENRRIEEDNRKKTEDFEYFTSQNYIDKIAKQNLGLINPGEQVIVLSSQNLPKPGQILSSDESTDNILVDLENKDKWWYFFFDRTAI